MDTKNNDDLLFLVSYATELRKYQHLYLRGNYQMEMFYDKVDKIHVWNRLWLSAAATGVQILSAVILNNHLHICALIDDDMMRSDFKHHFRMSISQYHNHRYDRHGMLGERIFHHASLKDTDDLKDCICYHVRNVLHHRVALNFLDYPFSTARFVFGMAEDGQKGVFNYASLPDNLSFLPVRETLPVGWMVTRNGMIVPPHNVFRGDMVEILFGSKDAYLEQLSNKSIRESDDTTELRDFRIDATKLRKIQTTDEKVVEFLKENVGMDVLSMNDGQKMETIMLILNKFPQANPKMLGRLFGIPYTTLRYRVQHFRIDAT